MKGDLKKKKKLNEGIDFNNLTYCYTRRAPKYLLVLKVQ